MNSMTTNNSMTVNNPKTAFDNWRSIVISLYMTLVGYGVLVGIPVISTAWVSLLGFSEVEVGRVAGADLGGLSLGAVLTAFFIARVNRRLLVLLVSPSLFWPMGSASKWLNMSKCFGYACLPVLVAVFIRRSR